MSAFQYKSGLGNSAAYQVSGTPQVDSGSGAATTIIDYDYVTSEVAIINVSSSGRITAYFDGSSEGLALPEACCQIKLNIKCRQVKIVASGAAGWSVCAALTTIDKNELPTP